MRLIIVFISLLVLFACSPSKIELPNPPKDLIPEDSFKLVLTQLVVLEAYIENKYNAQVLQYQGTMTKSGDKLLKDFHIPFERFNSSMIYYGENQVKMDSIYTEIMDTLSVRSAKMN